MKASIQQIAVLVAISISSVTAFVPQHITSTKFGVKQDAIRSSVALEASKNKEKIASRTKWAESRGYGESVTGSSDDGARKAPKLIIAGVSLFKSIHLLVIGPSLVV